MILAQALLFLTQTLGNLFIIAALLRFMMQMFRVSFKNPLSPSPILRCCPCVVCCQGSLVRIGRA
jgi:hypothetical protein